jgi:hypothetical protein
MLIKLINLCGAIKLGDLRPEDLVNLETYKEFGLTDPDKTDMVQATLLVASLVPFLTAPALAGLAYSAGKEFWEEGQRLTELEEQRRNARKSKDFLDSDLDLD